LCLVCVWRPHHTEFDPDTDDEWDLYDAEGRGRGRDGAEDRVGGEAEDRTGDRGEDGWDLRQGP
jgi:hypothetical protein